MAEIVSSIAGVCGIVEKAGACGLRHVNYIFKIREALQNAERKVSTLTSKRADLQTRVDRDGHLVNYRPREEVVNVLKEMGVAVSEFENLNADILNDTHDTCCFCSFSFSKLRTVYGYGRRLDKLMKVVVDLTSRCDFDEVVIELPPSKVVEVPTATSYGIQITVDRALARIRDENVTAVGIYGMGGIGKTTILREINNKLSSADEFESVIWVDVSRHVDLSEIINCIARRMGLTKDFENWKGETQEHRRSEVYDRLKTTRFVLLLDDVWNKDLKLEDIGIPFLKPPSHSKVVLTSRYLEVCENLGAQERIKVECLGKEDSWALFSNKVGQETLNAHPDILTLAEKVCDRCSGFPLLLTVLGRRMAYKTTVADWEFILSRLNINILEEKDILATLQLSYDDLKSETTKSCFLYLCFYVKTNALQQEDDLVQQWFAEGLLDDNYDEALKSGHNTIRELQSASLCDVVHAENFFHQVYYKIHDVIVEMGHQVVSQGKRNFCKKFPTENCAYEAEKIFICESDMEKLDKPSICPRVSTLIISNNRYLKTINEDFFNTVSHLRVLNLFGCRRLERLPNGINLLTRLRYLNIGNTSLKTLPENFQELTELQILKSNDGLRFPQGVLSNFKKLLVFEYPVDGKAFMDQPLAIEMLKELSGLTQLINIVLPPFEYFSETFKYFTNSSNLLEHTSIFVLQRSVNDLSATEEAIDISFINRMPNLRFFGLDRLNNPLTFIPSESQDFTSVVSLGIDRCNALEDISYLLHYMPKLEHLELYRCDGMKAILKKEGSGQIIDADTRRFGRLQTLNLKYMSSLEYISPDNQQFPYLQMIILIECPKLHKLPFNASNAGKLSSIKGGQKWFDDLQWENEESHCFASDKFQAISK